jgi:hypothetical protein
MDTITFTQSEAGCVLSNQRGHYISRDVIQLAESYGFIIGSFEDFALEMYEAHNHEDNYPHEAVTELCDEAVNWLNSGQDKCQECAVGSGDIRPGQVPMATVDDHGHVSGTTWVICKGCSGTGRGPREAGQNFPPIVPEGFTWAFEDGDFGLWFYNEDGEFDLERN